MLKARVLTALILLAGFLAVLFLLPFSGWLLFASLVAGMGCWEWGGLIQLGYRRRQAYSLAGFLFCAVLAVLVFDAENGAIRLSALLLAVYFIACAFWLVAVPAWMGGRWALSKGLPSLMTGWLVLIPACLALMQLRTSNPYLLLAAMAFVWLADIAAYFSGRRFGRHKLAPTISPGKTWEGVAGAGLAVAAYGLAMAWVAGMDLSFPGPVLAVLAAAELLMGLSILGDLFESMAKRQAGVKDSGALLPGHGGVLDRIDSLTSTLPMLGLALFVWEGKL
ncbi:MAG: phosphatidate cytidylyltransferase [Rhodocyclaceae bacterium]|nr:phosphatidate cytidylyltransferase [Rhodocyclaceae bacterium]